MKKFLLIFLNFSFLFASTLLQAQMGQIDGHQNLCGSPVPDLAWEAQLQALISQNKVSQSGQKQQSLYTIPVIIHVIHGGQAVGTYPNLSNGQLVSQIQTLNNDYGGIGYNSGIYPLNAFSAYAMSQALPSNNLDQINRVKIANCGVQFCLATKDTNGNALPEPGIDRINYVTRNWNNPGTISGLTTFQNYVNSTIKPQTIWNVSKYLNIWVTDENIASNGLLGYATFPVLSNLTGLGGNLASYAGTNISDGLWCYAKAFGSSIIYPAGTYYQNYTFGRTSTHEIGHWLGLRHIWGDANCATDYCDDTPPAKTSNFNSIFAYPYHSGTCTGNSPDGEMVMNFMDYTNDNAKYMFTTDQATRMQTAMQNSPYRKFLGSHNLCSVADIAAIANFTSVSNVCVGASLNLVNQSLGVPVPSFTWSSNAAAVFNPNNSLAYTVTFPTAGIFTISLAAYNGTLSTVTKTVNVLAAPSLTLNPSRTNFCLGENVTLDMQGANTYYWQPDSLLTSYISLPSDHPAEYSYTCVATGAGACKTTTVLNITIRDCTGLLDANALDNRFDIYPNPSNGLITVQSKQNFNEAYDIDIYDPLGKLVMKQSVAKNASAKPITIDVSALNKGIYLMRFKDASGKLGHKTIAIE